MDPVIEFIAAITATIVVATIITIIWNRIA